MSDNHIFNFLLKLSQYSSPLAMAFSIMIRADKRVLTTVGQAAMLTVVRVDPGQQAVLVEIMVTTAGLVNVLA